MATPDFEAAKAKLEEKRRKAEAESRSSTDTLPEPESVPEPEPTVIEPEPEPPKPRTVIDESDLDDDLTLEELEGQLQDAVDRAALALDDIDRLKPLIEAKRRAVEAEEAKPDPLEESRAKVRQLVGLEEPDLSGDSKPDRDSSGGDTKELESDRKPEEKKEEKPKSWLRRKFPELFEDE